MKTGRHEERQKETERFCAKLSVAKGELAKLQSVAFREIVDNQAAAGPVLDGNVVPRDPFDPDAPAISANVPMIIGTCLQDFGFTITETSDDDASLRKWVENQLRPLKAEGRADEVLALYRKHYPRENGFLLRAILGSDRSVRRSAVTQAERKAAQSAAPVYMYRWDWPAHGEGAHWGAVHGTDPPLLFGPARSCTILPREPSPRPAV